MSVICESTEKMLERPFIFRLNDGTGPLLLQQVFHERGWKEYSDSNPLRETGWNIWWRTGGVTTAYIRNLKSWQFINHIPKASCITRKDCLCRYLRCMKNNFGIIYDFSPDAFILPVDYTKLIDQCSRSFYRNKEKDVWIYKPVGQSQGRGITVFRNISEIEYGSNAVVQRYIRNPLLIGGYKFDLRLYVCVPCFHPLTIYTYREGLARFSTDKYSLQDLNNRYAHLTNTSVNKQSPGYSEMKDRVGAGCKWNLKQLRFYFEQNDIDDWLLWQKISNIIVLTVVSQINGIPSTSNCFEFYGFDILIDNSLKPWLLEVNSSPALGTDCDIDPAVKKPMLHDLFDLLGLPICNTGLSLFTDWTDVTISPYYWHAMKEPKSRPSTAVNVVSMATKWKRHTQESKSHESDSKKPMRIKKCAAVPKTEHFASADDKGIPKCRWENGRDWRSPPSCEGDWVRIYPFQCQKQQSTTGSPVIERGRDFEVKDIVNKVGKFFKSAREVSSDKMTDWQRDETLLSAPYNYEVIWHPNK